MSQKEQGLELPDGPGVWFDKDDRPWFGRDIGTRWEFESLLNEDFFHLKTDNGEVWVYYGQPSRGGWRRAEPQELPDGPTGCYREGTRVYDSTGKLLVDTYTGMRPIEECEQLAEWIVRSGWSAQPAGGADEAKERKDLQDKTRLRMQVKLAEARAEAAERDLAAVRKERDEAKAERDRWRAACNSPTSEYQIRTLTAQVQRLREALQSRPRGGQGLGTLWGEYQRWDGKARAALAETAEVKPDAKT